MTFSEAIEFFVRWSAVDAASINYKHRELLEHPVTFYAFFGLFFLLFWWFN